MLSADEFAILPWGWTPGDEQALNDIRECGFNLAGFVAPESVKQVESAGLQCFVSDPRITGSIGKDDMADAEIADLAAQCVSPFKGNKAVYGYYLRDEPAVDLYPNLGRWAAAVRKVDPDTRPYMNLFPMVASMEQLGAKDYNDYVDSFVATTKPPFISYDHYALFDDGSVRDTFYQNLEAIRSAGIRHNLPFWNIVLGNAHFHYAEPTQGTLNLQVFATLACGARGLSYFTYFAPLIGNYRDAAVDQFMNKTPTWDMLRRVNLQIHKLGPTYLQLRSINVFHHPNVPEGCQGIGSSKHVAELNGGNFLVGEFDGPDGKPYVMIVNKDIHRSTAFDVKFKQSGSIMMTSSYTGQLAPWAGENNWLAPGQGMLLSMERDRI